MMETVAAILCACFAGAAGALAYGYRGQRDQEREQVVWLRKELAAVRAPTPQPPQGEVQRGQGNTSRALTTVQG